jgi:hypothetical protein
MGSPILRFLSASEQSRNSANRSTLVLIAGQRREQVQWRSQSEYQLKKQFALWT